MPYYKFKENDIFYNRLKANPECQFWIYRGKVYYNNNKPLSGSLNGTIPVTHVPTGSISLYEINVDRPSDSLIYPFITKDGGMGAFKTVSLSSFNTGFDYGDTITGEYPLSATISKERWAEGAAALLSYSHIEALQTTLDFYKPHSNHYAFNSSLGNKFDQALGLISVPSIFYGSSIKKGSVYLRFYVSGTLAAELHDRDRNGELIEVSGSSTGSVAGVIMYNEGFVLLTGSWALNEESIPLISGGAATSPSWLYFGAGANDGVSKSTAGQDYISASFDFSFKGVTETEVLTMFAHARRGEVNYSNNPTFLTYGQEQIQTTSSNRYEENPSRTIYNTVSSSYKDYYAPFKRQVYVSKVAIYDKDKNLIGIATMANPILKEEDQDITFKLKLDI